MRGATMFRSYCHLLALIWTVQFLAALALTDYCDNIGDADFDCSEYNPTHCYRKGGGGKCIPELESQKKAFNVCRDNLCFLLKQEAPIIIIPEDQKKQKLIAVPFKCNESGNKSIEGSLVDIFKGTAAGNQYCVWVGENPDCTWNRIQHLVASNSGYKFAAGGPMLETAQRKCHHVPSSSWLDDRMVIVGNLTSAPNENPWTVVTAPLSRNAWITFLVVFFLHVLVFVFIGSRVHWCDALQYRAAASYFLITGDEGNILESKFFNDDQKQQHGQDPHEQQEIVTRLTFLASVFRISLKACFLIFLIFYEAGLVNLLFFRHKTVLEKKSVGSISRGQLPEYCVMKDSALANVWRSRVDPNNEVSENEMLRWQEEDGLVSCLHRIQDKNDHVRFAVSYEREARFQIKKENSEGDSTTTLAVFELEKDIYRFNSGWLFKKTTNQSDEKLITYMNIDITLARVQRDLENWLDDNKDRESKNTKKTITLEVLALSLSASVYLPLFLAAVFLIFWGRLKLEWHPNLWCLRLEKGSKGKKEAGNTKNEDEDDVSQGSWHNKLCLESHTPLPA